MPASAALTELMSDLYFGILSFSFPSTYATSKMAPSKPIYNNKVLKNYDCLKLLRVTARSVLIDYFRASQSLLRLPVDCHPDIFHLLSNAHINSHVWPSCREHSFTDISSGNLRCPFTFRVLVTLLLVVVLLLIHCAVPRQNYACQESHYASGTVLVFPSEFWGCSILVLCVP